MLSRARSIDDIAESDNEEVSENYFTSEHICRVNVIWEFREEEYKGESLLIRKMLQEIEESSDSKEKKTKIWSKKRQVQKFFLNNGLIWRESKRPDGIPLRVVGTKDQRNKIMSKFHESDWAGHQGTWGIFAKRKQKYCWKNMYKDVAGSRKAVRDVKSTSELDTDMNFIWHSQRQSTSNGWSTLWPCQPGSDKRSTWCLGHTRFGKFSTTELTDYASWMEQYYGCL